MNNGESSNNYGGYESLIPAERKHVSTMVGEKIAEATKKASKAAAAVVKKQKDKKVGGDLVKDPANSLPALLVAINDLFLNLELPLAIFLQIVRRQTPAAGSSGTSKSKANPAPAPLTRKCSTLVIRERSVSSALTSIEEVGLSAEEDEEPSLLRKNSKLARLEELPTVIASSSHEPVPVTDMGIPFTPSPSPLLSESSPATTVEPGQASIPSSVVPLDPIPSSSAIPAPLAPPEGVF
ncbi:hypothetical protein BUALT_Bualt08G0113400 [Buddleja alternifolia]|uniref:Uncharacterized protein n=1 Tax=Buddleja alternifolia TaxID=168488 RepID=A0AAV6XGH0_9LAMI|nr:hypothetical protein BUALT_Bualt08G0113400 [Buddleja alternifolia]